MGRRKTKSSRIRAIHYKLGNTDEVFYLDNEGRHINREIEKIDKPKHTSLQLENNSNESNSNTLKNNNILPDISKMTAIPPPQNNVSIQNQNKKLSSKFYEACTNFPAASLMWINNPEYAESV